jgi:hypothetical protein
MTLPVTAAKIWRSSLRARFDARHHPEAIPWLLAMEDVKAAAPQPHKPILLMTSLGLAFRGYSTYAGY